MINPCPNCGSRSTYVAAQARGPAQYHYDEEGIHIETAYDHLHFMPSDTVRCADCGKIRRDLERVGRVVRVKDIGA